MKFIQSIISFLVATISLLSAEAASTNGIIRQRQLEQAFACYYNSDGQYQGTDFCDVDDDLSDRCDETGSVCTVGSTGPCNGNGAFSYATYYVLEENNCPDILPSSPTDAPVPPVNTVATSESASAASNTKHHPSKLTTMAAFLLSMAAGGLLLLQF